MMETKRRREQRSMLPVHPDAAAIDIGATVHVAAVGPARDPQPVRSFGTCTGDLHRLADWFAQCGIKTVVMESTGVYWIPIYEILEQRGFEVWVVIQPLFNRYNEGLKVLGTGNGAGTLAMIAALHMRSSLNAVMSRSLSAGAMCGGSSTRSR